MAAVMPGDVGTEPSAKLIFNAPFDQPVTVNCRLSNKGGKKVGWAVKSTNNQRYRVEPPCGVIGAKETVGRLL